MCLDFCVFDVKKGITKCRMITGTYLLQTNCHKFSKATVSAICKCCGLNEEDLAHLLLECPSLINQRKPLYTELKSKVINCIGAMKWRELFNNKRENLVKLILDCSSFSVIKDKAEYPAITKLSTELCYRLHVARTNKLAGTSA